MEAAQMNDGYVYTIEKTKSLNAVDANKAVPKNPYSYEYETSVPYKIPTENIKGARLVDSKSGKFTGEFIKNPNYLTGKAK
jgi:hypothetical protein